MRKLNVSNSISLDGYFTGENGDLSWAHRAFQNGRVVLDYER